MVGVVGEEDEAVDQSGNQLVTKVSRGFSLVRNKL